MRVLIVDDEPELVGALVERLGLRGITAEGAESGAVALDKIRAQDYDVVLLDLKMPGMGGLEVTRRMHEHKPDLRIILLTGHFEAAGAEQARAAGATACLVKPASMETLLAALQAATEG